MVVEILGAKPPKNGSVAPCLESQGGVATSLRRHKIKSMIGRIPNTELSESSLTLNMSMGQNLWDHNWEDYHSFYQLF